MLHVIVAICFGFEFEHFADDLGPSETNRQRYSSDEKKKDQIKKRNDSIASSSSKN